eukprot:scaffold10326_cov79-Isochrysis_galbana.AAC.2
MQGRWTILVPARLIVEDELAAFKVGAVAGEVEERRLLVFMHAHLRGVGGGGAGGGSCGEGREWHLVHVWPRIAEAIPTPLAHVERPSLARERTLCRRAGPRRTDNRRVTQNRRGGYSGPEAGQRGVAESQGVEGCAGGGGDAAAGALDGDVQQRHRPGQRGAPGHPVRQRGGEAERGLATTGEGAGHHGHPGRNQ